MPLTPGYRQTPLPHDELTALLPAVADILDKPITHAAIYDLEQGLQDQVFDELMPSALDGSLPLDEFLSDDFVRKGLARAAWAGVRTLATLVMKASGVQRKAVRKGIGHAYRPGLDYVASRRFRLRQ